MKNTFLFLTAFLFVACASTVKNSQKLDDMSDDVRRALQEKCFCIVVNDMMPQRYFSKNLNSYHDIKVKGNVLESNLPYMGQVQVPSAYSSFPKGLNFTEKIRDFSQSDNPRKKRVEISLKVKNEEDSYIYNVFIYYNGNADITVKPSKRDFVRFHGDLTKIEY